MTHGYRPSRPATRRGGPCGQRVFALSGGPGVCRALCPNPNLTPEIREGTLEHVSFSYTLIFEGFCVPYHHQHQTIPDRVGH